MIDILFAMTWWTLRFQLNIKLKWNVDKQPDAAITRLRYFIALGEFCKQVIVGVHGKICNMFCVRNHMKTPYHHRWEAVILTPYFKHCEEWWLHLRNEIPQNHRGRSQCVVKPSSDWLLLLKFRIVISYLRENLQWTQSNVRDHEFINCIVNNIFA